MVGGEEGTPLPPPPPPPQERAKPKETATRTEMTTRRVTGGLEGKAFAFSGTVVYLAWGCLGPIHARKASRWYGALGASERASVVGSCALPTNDHMEEYLHYRQVLSRDRLSQLLSYSENCLGSTQSVGRGIRVSGICEGIEFGPLIERVTY